MKKILFSLLLVFSLQTNAKEIELTLENSFLFAERIDEESAEMFVLMYNLLRARTNKDIYVILHSPGGNFLAASAIINTIKHDKKLHAVIVLAASGAAAISQNVAGNVYIVPKGQLLFHEAKFTPPDQRGLSITYIQKVLNALFEANRTFAQQCNRRMKLSSYDAKVKDKDWILGAKEAETVNAAKVQIFKCSKELEEFDAVVTTYSYLTGIPSKVNVCGLLN